MRPVDPTVAGFLDFISSIRVFSQSFCPNYFTPAFLLSSPSHNFKTLKPNFILNLTFPNLKPKYLPISLTVLSISPPPTLNRSLYSLNRITFPHSIEALLFVSFFKSQSKLCSVWIHSIEALVFVSDTPPFPPFRFRFNRSFMWNHCCLLPHCSFLHLFLFLGYDFTLSSPLSFSKL